MAKFPFGGTKKRVEAQDIDSFLDTVDLSRIVKLAEYGPTVLARYKRGTELAGICVGEVLNERTNVIWDWLGQIDSLVGPMDSMGEIKLISDANNEFDLEVRVGFDFAFIPLKIKLFAVFKYFEPYTLRLTKYKGGDFGPTQFEYRLVEVADGAKTLFVVNYYSDANQIKLFAKTLLKWHPELNNMLATAAPMLLLNSAREKYP